MPALPVGQPIAGTHDEPVQPRVEPVGVAQPADVPPGGDERLLDGVLGALAVVED